MKRIILSMILLGFWMTSTAQINKNAILGNLRSELIPQIKGDDYNPYQFSREEFILSCLEVRISYERVGYCEEVMELIENFDEAKITGEVTELIREISLFQCKESYEFLVDQIKNSPSEAVRCDAINALAWSLNSDYLPCILDYAKRDSLSVEEKLALANAYTVYGIYTSEPALKEEAIRFLDEICYDASIYSDLEHNCIWTYYKLGGKPAIIFFNSWYEKQEGLRRISAAVFLAELGEYEKTFPIFAEAIHSDITNDVIEAIDGLKVIGTEKALQLIEKQALSENEKIAKKAQEVLKKLNEERSEKWKE